MPRILLVDDEPPILTSTGLLLEAYAFRVATTSDHRAVLRKVLDERPDVILHDVRMPGLDWGPHLAALRADPVARHVPIILYSAYLALGDLQRDLGVAASLEKPCHPTHLLATIEHVLRRVPRGPT